MFLGAHFDVFVGYCGARCCEVVRELCDRVGFYVGARCGVCEIDRVRECFELVEFVDVICELFDLDEFFGEEYLDYCEEEVGIGVWVYEYVFVCELCGFGVLWVDYYDVVVVFVDGVQLLVGVGCCY